MELTFTHPRTYHLQVLIIWNFFRPIHQTKYKSVIPPTSYLLLSHLHSSTPPVFYLPTKSYT
jgi:hypothetical protein